MDGINLPPIDIWRCVIPLVALLIGWAIGFVDSNQRTAKKIKAAETRAELAIKEAQDKVAEAESRSALLPASVPDDNKNLLRLMKEDEGLMLELDGQKVLAPTLLPEQRKRLIGLLTIMRPWLEGDSAQPAARSIAPASSTGAVQQARPAPVSSPQGTPIIAAPISPEAKPDTKRPAPPQSIVEQIDSILQARMMNTPLAQRDIRVQESHEGGVEVMVGRTRYETVDDVPDAEIKSAIRAAIEEWEKRYTPGL
jgi:hypothetical protein